MHLLIDNLVDTLGMDTRASFHHCGEESYLKVFGSSLFSTKPLEYVLEICCPTQLKIVLEEEEKATDIG